MRAVSMLSYASILCVLLCQCVAGLSPLQERLLTALISANISCRGLSELESSNLREGNTDGTNYSIVLRRRLELPENISKSDPNDVYQRAAEDLLTDMQHCKWTMESVQAKIPGALQQQWSEAELEVPTSNCCKPVTEEMLIVSIKSCAASPSPPGNRILRVSTRLIPYRRTIAFRYTGRCSG